MSSIYSLHFSWTFLILLRFISSVCVGLFIHVGNVINLPGDASLPSHFFLGVGHWEMKGKLCWIMDSCRLHIRITGIESWPWDPRCQSLEGFLLGQAVYLRKDLTPVVINWFDLWTSAKDLHIQHVDIHSLAFVLVSRAWDSFSFSPEKNLLLCKYRQEAI